MDSIPAWIAVGTALGSAIAFFIRLFQEGAARRRREFLEMMEFIDSPGPIAKKMTAAYFLRKYPEHRDFIIRFCTVIPASALKESGTASILRDEFAKSKAFMEAKK